MVDFPWIRSYPPGVRRDAELRPTPIEQLLALERKRTTETTP